MFNIWSFCLLCVYERERERERGEMGGGSGSLRDTTFNSSEGLHASVPKPLYQANATKKEIKNYQNFCCL
jgi:hypothetical protein